MVRLKRGPGKPISCSREWSPHWKKRKSQEWEKICELRGDAHRIRRVLRESGIKFVEIDLAAEEEGSTQFLFVIPQNWTKRQEAALHLALIADHVDLGERPPRRPGARSYRPPRAEPPPDREAG